jgi:hypothetical protein
MTTIYIARTFSGFHIKLKSDNPDAFRLCIDTLKSSITSDMRSYNPATREWFVDEDAAGRMRRWLEYCRANLHAEVEWLDGETYEDPEAEWTPPKPERPKASDPYVTLHLLPSAPPEVVKAAYRALAVLNHPDKGGDEEAMKRLNEAYGRLLAA